MAQEQQITAVIKARDEASKTIQDVGKSFSGLGSMAAGLGKAMVGLGAAAGAAAVAIGVKGVADYAEAEKAQAQLEHAVLNVSKATREQLDATSDLADALERKGVLDGDNIKTGLAQLSTFGLSNEAVRGLGGSLADLAVNQFGVSASGEQLATTANTIAKALNGQFGVLEKSGIRFTEAQQKAIEFGTEMEKVAAINEGFAQNLKYTNEVAAQTTEGGFAKMNVALGNLSESVGQVLSPYIIKLINEAIIPLANKILEVMPTVEGLEAGFLSLKDQFVQLATEFDAKTGIITALKEGFDRIYKVVQDELMPSLSRLFEAMKPLEPLFAAIAKVIGAVLVVAIRLLIEVLSRTIEFVVLLVSRFAEVAATIYEVLQPALDFIANGIGKVGDALEWVISKFSAMRDAAVAAFNAARDAVMAVPGAGAVMGAISGRALGGPVYSGTPYVVGENGPEMFVPNQSGTIMPRVGGGGGSNVTLNLNVNTMIGGNPTQVANEIGDLIIKKLQTNARIA